MRAFKTTFVVMTILLAFPASALAQTASASASVSASASATASEGQYRPGPSGANVTTSVNDAAAVIASAVAGATDDIADGATKGTDAALDALTAPGGSATSNGSTAPDGSSSPDESTAVSAPAALSSSTITPSSAPPEAKASGNVYGITALPETGGATPFAPLVGMLLVGAGLSLVRRAV